MSPHVRVGITCLSIATAFFLFSTLVSDIVARTTIGSQTFGNALSQHAYYAATQPIATGLLLAPFLLVAWMAFSIARCNSIRRGIVFLCIVCSVLGVIYFFAYRDSQLYMKEQMWTAATLAIGSLVVKSVPVLLVSLVASRRMCRGQRLEP
jgi:hypothetical protein